MDRAHTVPLPGSESVVDRAHSDPFPGTEPVLAAVIQLCSGADRAANLERAGHLMERAAGRGAGLLVLPENFSYMGQTEADKRRHREHLDDSPSLRFLMDFSRRRHLWIIGGSIPMLVADDDKSTSSCFVLDPEGAIQARYDKIHLFDVSLGSGEPYRESAVIRPGRTPVSVPTPFGRVGLSICYDLRFPELYRRLVGEGSTILTVPSAFTLTTGKDHWELLLRARAVENFAYVLAPNQDGVHPGGRRTYGHSLIVDPWGTVVARCPDGEGFALAELDPARVKACRDQIPCLTHRVIA
ncbi:MAG: carbon-nitrogen hydrolase family protein [Magnetococcales bacterium]|nr:carbon-nitrogen hydrolase family protein [Magnetococcales bacterium]